jgi:hypothetical protein
VLHTAPKVLALIGTLKNGPHLLEPARFLGRDLKGLDLEHRLFGIDRDGGPVGHLGDPLGLPKTISNRSILTPVAWH